MECLNHTLHSIPKATDYCSYRNRVPVQAIYQIPEVRSILNVFFLSNIQIIFPLSDDHRKQTEVLPFSITFDEDADGAYFKAEPIENYASKYSCSVCVKTFQNSFSKLVRHVKSSHSESFSLKTACSVCDIPQEFNEVQAKYHFRKHFIENKIEVCRLKFANPNNESSHSQNCSAKISKRDKIDVVLLFADNDYVYRCEECNIYFKIARNFLNHIGPRGPHCQDYPEFRHETDPSNVWCKICKLKLTGFKYVTIHARKYHEGVRRVEFELVSSVETVEESDNSEPAKKKLKR